MAAQWEERLGDLICHCRSLGCTTKEIQELLLPINSFSMRYIQRKLKKRGMGINTRNSIADVKAAIEKELEGPGCLLGYRSVWRRLTSKYQLSVSRDTVMMLLATMDPMGTCQRKSRRLNRRIYLNKGPNYLWHIDGYDKLKPYGIAIHGCIDGFSRKILWLKASSSNNDPRIISYYYVNCVRSLSGCPKILRADLGTENSLLALIQPILRHYDGDLLSGSKSFLYGKSVNNQRIEALWCQLRKLHTDWWISFFKELVANGYLQIHLPYHQEIVRYCFGPLIETELEQFMNEWNSHRIRPSKHADAPAGVPNVMFSFPILHGTHDYKMPTLEARLDAVVDEFDCTPGSMYSEEFGILANLVQSAYGLDTPTSFNTAITLFEQLIEIFDNN